MREIKYTLFIAALLPLFAHAYTIENISASQTGGMRTSPGETIVKAGDSSAEVRTVIRGTSGSGTVDVRVSTEQNGVRQTETRHYDIPASGSVLIEVATSSYRSTTSASRARAAASVSVSARGIGTTTLPFATSTATSGPIERTGAFSWLFGIPRRIFALFTNVFISLR